LWSGEGDRGRSQKLLLITTHFFYVRDLVIHSKTTSFRACAQAKVWSSFFAILILSVARFLFFSALLLWPPFALLVLSGCRETLDVYYGRSIEMDLDQSFGFINWVDNVNWPP